MIEVKAEQSTEKRSLTSGHLLVVTLPKFNPKDKAFIQKQQHKSSPLLVGNDGKKGMDSVDNVSNNMKRQSSHSNGKILQHKLL